MRHKRRLISISLAALMLVSLCAVCASTGVTAATNSGGTQASSQEKTTDIVGAPPGGLGSAPAVCSWGPGRLDVFARGTDVHLWHTWWDGNWRSWEDLGQPFYGLASAPTAVSWGYGRIDVFGRDATGYLVHKWFDNGWHDWDYLGVPTGTTISVNSAPAACSWGAGRLDIFVMGSDGNLWQKWFEGSGGWRTWEPLGQPDDGIWGSPGAVSTVSWGYARIDIFIRGGDGALWQKWWGNGWQPWHRFDDTAGLLAVNAYTASGGSSHYGLNYYAPAVCSWGANRLDVFFVDMTGHLVQKWFNGNWQPLSQVGGTTFLSASPSAVTWQLNGATRLDIFSRDTNLALLQLYWAGSGWQGWYNLGAV